MLSIIKTIFDEAMFEQHDDAGWVFFSRRVHVARTDPKAWITLELTTYEYYHKAAQRQEKIRCRLKIEFNLLHKQIAILFTITVTYATRILRISNIRPMK